MRDTIDSITRAVSCALSKHQPIWPGTLRYVISAEPRDDATHYPHVELALRANNGANILGIERRFLRPPHPGEIHDMLQTLNRAGAD